MSLSDHNKADIAFKNLRGKSQTSETKEIQNESESLALKIHKTNVWMSIIDEDPGNAISSCIANQVTADLVPDPTSNGQAFFAIYPVGHALAGQRAAPAIPPLYGDGYQALLYAAGNIAIPIDDDRDWIYQYEDGVLFQQTATASPTPLTITIYIYAGQTLDNFVFGVSGISGNGASGFSGQSGFSGNSGFSGETGPAGISGTSGFSGTPGISTGSGFSGNSGFSGQSGLSGTSGISGISGLSGTSGISGISGISGFSGTPGVSSVSGFSGTSGFSGLSGTSGTSGISGFSGTLGFSGLSGQSGFSGASGFSGISGLSGISGSGLSGQSGFSGTSGKSGFSGVSGISGFSGFSGVTPNPFLQTVISLNVSSSLVATDASLANFFDVNATANFTLSNPTNSTNGQKILWRITQNTSATIAFGTNFDLGGQTITLSVGSGKVDYIVAIYRSAATKWDVLPMAGNY